VAKGDETVARPSRQGQGWLSAGRFSHNETRLGVPLNRLAKAARVPILTQNMLATAPRKAHAAARNKEQADHDSKRNEPDSSGTAGPIVRQYAQACSLICALEMQERHPAKCSGRIDAEPMPALTRLDDDGGGSAAGLERRQVFP
jgi:hypothetical protein